MVSCSTITHPLWRNRLSGEATPKTTSPAYNQHSAISLQTKPVQLLLFRFFTYCYLFFRSCLLSSLSLKCITVNPAYRYVEANSQGVYQLNLRKFKLTHTPTIVQGGRMDGPPPPPPYVFDLLRRSEMNLH